MTEPVLAERPPTWLELESVKPLAEAEEITSLDRVLHHPPLPSPARTAIACAMGNEVADILAIADGSAPRS